VDFGERDREALQELGELACKLTPGVGKLHDGTLIRGSVRHQRGIFRYLAQGYNLVLEKGDERVVIELIIW